MADDIAALPDARAQDEHGSTIEYSYQEDKPYLIRFLLRQGADFEEAQDAVHSAFVELMRARKPVEYPRAWLRTVALRAFLKQAVRVSENPDQEVVERVAETSADWRTPLEAAELSEQQRQVLAALLQLPFKQRSVLAWHLDGFSTQEIAESMGMQQPAVLQNLSRARRALKQQLGITEGGRDE